MTNVMKLHKQVEVLDYLDNYELSDLASYINDQTTNEMTAFYKKCHACSVAREKYLATGKDESGTGFKSWVEEKLTFSYASARDFAKIYDIVLAKRERALQSLQVSQYALRTLSRIDNEEIRNDIADRIFNGERMSSNEIEDAEQNHRITLEIERQEDEEYAAGQKDLKEHRKVISETKDVQLSRDNDRNRKFATQSTEELTSSVEDAVEVLKSNPESLVELATASFSDSDTFGQAVVKMITQNNISDKANLEIINSLKKQNEILKANAIPEISELAAKEEEIGKLKAEIANLKQDIIDLQDEIEMLSNINKAV